MKAKEIGKLIGGCFVAVVILVGLVGGYGVDLWPFGTISNQQETTIRSSGPVQVNEIRPIGLDCRAYIRATVPVEGKREHSALKVTYRTDTLRMQAVGDLDVCVPAEASNVLRVADGRFVIEVDASKVIFNRPRIDAEATLGSVDEDKGFVGRYTDIFPWVETDTGLTPAGYAFAQTLVGGAECASNTWDTAMQAIEIAYLDIEAARQGVEPAVISVEFIGTPDFAQNVQPEEFEFGKFKFEVSEGVQCVVDPDALSLDAGDIVSG